MGRYSTLVAVVLATSSSSSTSAYTDSVSARSPNWNAGEPNNFRYENGEEEHCLELWNRDGKGLKWNDTPCSFETYFICEV